MLIAATSPSGAARMRMRSRVGLATLLLLASCSTAASQSPGPPQYLKGLSPAGARSYLTESWSTLRFALSNPTADDMEARLLTFYPGTPDRQYGRNVWAPAKSTL